MKVVKIQLTLEQRIFVGNYETIAPAVSLTAELEPGEDSTAASMQLQQILSADWAKVAMLELKNVARRRNAEMNDELRKAIEGVNKLIT